MTHYYIAVLRGINVGGRKKVLMNDLKILFTELGYLDVVSYIQSGNIIFGTTETNIALIEENIKLKLLNSYEFNIPLTIRSASEIAHLHENNPFSTDNEIEKLHLTFLSKVPAKDRIKQIEELQNTSLDSFQVIGKNVFLLCRGKYHKSKFSTAFFEKKLAVTATTRNWKTVSKLRELSSIHD